MGGGGVWRLAQQVRQRRRAAEARAAAAGRGELDDAEVGGPGEEEEQHVPPRCEGNRQYT